MDLLLSRFDEDHWPRDIASKSLKLGQDTIGSRP
jgi:hypothetical protein